MSRPAWARVAAGAAMLATAAAGAGCEAGADGTASLSEYYTAVAQYQGLLGDGGDEEDDGTAGDQRTYGEIVASCMKAEGFEYWPEGAAIGAESSGEDDVGEEDPVAWAAREGYGIVEPYEQLDMTIQWDDPAPVDPNQEYTSMMTEAEFEAYVLAFYGTIWDELVEAAERGEEFVWDWTRAGCDGRASHIVESRENVWTGPASSTLGPYDELVAAMDDIALEVESTPQWAEAVTEWSDCMAAAGYGYAALDDPFEDILTALDALWAEALPEHEIGYGEVVWVEAGQDGLPDRDEYDGLRRREIDTAVADETCRVEAELEVARAVAQDELEREFLAENRDELDAMVDWFSLHG